MGFYSQVQITAEKEAFKEFDKFLKENVCYFDIHEKDDVYVISIDWIKWYPEFDEVKDINSLMDKFDTEEYTSKDGYGYKMVILNEDNTSEERSNEKGEDKFSPMTIQCYIENPFL